MLVRNELFQPIELSAIVNDITNEYHANPNVSVSEDEAMNALAQLYYQSNLIANRHFFQNAAYAMPEAEKALTNRRSVKQLFEDIKQRFCQQYPTAEDLEDTADNIARIIADIIATVISGAVIIKPLLKVILFFFMGLTHKAICKAS